MFSVSIFVRFDSDSSVSFWITFFDYFPLVISVFFYDYFRITRCFMLRSTTNSTKPTICLWRLSILPANLAPIEKSGLEKYDSLFLFKYVLSRMGVSKESISKFLIGNRFHVKLRILSPLSNRIWIRTDLFYLNKDFLTKYRTSLEKITASVGRNCAKKHSKYEWSPMSSHSQTTMMYVLPLL